MSMEKWFMIWGIELKPCERCQSKNTAVIMTFISESKDGAEKLYFYIICKKCRQMTYAHLTKKDAINNWNNNLCA